MGFLRSAVIAVSVFIFLIGFLTVIFFLWASSGRVPPERLSSIQHFNGQAVSTSDGKDIFKIISYNLGYGSGRFNNRPERPPRVFFEVNLQSVAGLLKDFSPDIVCFQEIDFHAHRSHGINQMRKIAIGSGMTTAALAVNWDKRYVPFPYWPPSVHFRDIISGQGVVSSFPIEGVERIVLAEIKEKPFYYRAFYLDRLAQVVKIRIHNRILAVVNIHLEAFEPAARLRQAGEVLDIYRRLRKRYPVILAGDFNCVPPSASQKNGFPDEPDMDFRKSNAIEMFLNEPGLREAFLGEHPNRTETETFTFPATAPSRKLDYLFYSHRDIRCLGAEILHIDSSDHLPVMMTFGFRQPVEQPSGNASIR